jgi:hypothetical protein
MSDDWNDLFDDAADEVEKAEFELLPDGDYPVMITDFKFDETKTPARVTLICEVLTGEFKGRKLFNNFTLANKGPYFLKQTLLKMGVNEPKSANLMRDLNSIVGKSADAYVKVASYVGRDGQDKKINNVFINGPLVTQPDGVTEDNFDL